MTFSEKIQLKSFWVNVLKVGIPFFAIWLIFSLFLNSGKAILAGDFNTVNQNNFADLQWTATVLPKFIISLIYGIYFSNKNTK